MDSLNSTVESPYQMLLRAVISIPISHYLIGLTFCMMLFLYNFLEMHFFQDLLGGFRGQPVNLTFHPSSQLYHNVVSKCKVLPGRYLSTPWLCSPHLQTVFLSFFGNAPIVNYTRQLFKTKDGGTLALDWIVNSDAKKSAIEVNYVVQHDDRNPIIVIIPGLASDSRSSYIKHCAFKMAQNGSDVVVINHRGLGGVPLTSDRFYHGGWTDDVRTVIKHLHAQYPEAPLFAIGTSIGALILFSYLGEDKIDVPLVGAAAVCSPYDPLQCDRFMRRGILQNFYSKALARGLKAYAHKHEDVFSRTSNWEGVKKAYYCRDFEILHSV